MHGARGRPGSREVPIRHAGSVVDDVGDVELSELLAEVSRRALGAIDDQARQRLLLDAVVSISSELSLDRVLERIVAAASTLVGARYGALGVLAPDSEDRLSTFVHFGIPDEMVTQIGRLPCGRGVLGVIIDQPHPLRLHDLRSHPAFQGFPADHPDMTTFLGVPVRVRERVFGNLYLTQKQDGADFTLDDERVVVALASAAGVAIENAGLYTDVADRQAWSAATADITAALLGAGAGAGGDALQLIADRARQVSGAAMAWIAAHDDLHALSDLEDDPSVRASTTDRRPGGPSDPRLRVVSGPDFSHEGPKATVHADAAPTEQRLDRVSLTHSLAALVMDRGESVSVPDLASDDRAVDIAAAMGWPRLGPTVVVPLRGPAGVSGALALAWAPGQVDVEQVDITLPARFAEQAALALQLERAQADKQRLTLLEERDRIGRDLHDVVIQRLFAVGLGLEGVARRTTDPDIADRIGRSVAELGDTIKDIRHTIFMLGAIGRSPNVHDEVARIVEHAAAALKFQPSLRIDGPVRTMVDDDLAPDLLAVLGEALSNAVRHADAHRIDVTISATAHAVQLTVADDGVGLPPDAVESGLRNIRTRAERHGGHLRVTPTTPARSDTSLGGSEGEGFGDGLSAGTTLVWTVPLNS